jgi:hypothetical protein
MSTLTSIRTQPTALVIGPQKAGTTWIHDYLQDRGDVGLPRHVKETFYFDRYHDRGMEWYCRQFTVPAEARQIVEVAPTYFQNGAARARIAEDLGPIPVVCTLRDPVQRTFSHYVHMRRYGMTRLPLREAAATFPELLDSSRYSHHIRQWRSAVGEHNVHVLWMENLRDDPEAYVRSLCRALDIEYRLIPDALRGQVNQASMPKHHALARAGWKTADALRGLGLHPLVEAAKRLGLKKVFFGTPEDGNLPKMSADDREWLRDQLRPDDAILEELLQQSLGARRR